MPQNGKVLDERAPLLPPEPSTVDSSDEHIQDEEIDSKQAGRTISITRGILCVIALGCLIFLQATNISLLTTTQSVIADELDAFEKTSWFTSAYLVHFRPYRVSNSMSDMCRLPCRVLLQLAEDSPKSFRHEYASSSPQ